MIHVSRLYASELHCLEINTMEDVIESANCKLFKNSQNDQHCLYLLLTPIKPQTHKLRPKRHLYQFPNYTTELHKRSFIPLSHIAYSNIIIFSSILLCSVFISEVDSNEALTANETTENIKKTDTLYGNPKAHTQQVH